MKTQQKQTLIKLLNLITDHLDNNKNVKGYISFELENESNPWEYMVDCNIELENFGVIKDFNKDSEYNRFEFFQKDDNLNFFC